MNYLFFRIKLCRIFLKRKFIDMKYSREGKLSIYLRSMLIGQIVIGSCSLPDTVVGSETQLASDSKSAMMVRRQRL